MLVTAATEHGSTAEIAEAIGAALRAHGIESEVVAPEHVTDVERYDAAVVGSAVYVGHWLKPATELIDRCAAELSRRPVWLFSSGPVGDPSRKLVQKMGADPVDLPAIRHAVKPIEHRVFAGKLDKHNLSLPQRASLAVVRGLDGDFRDFAEIEAWAATISESLQRGLYQTGSDARYSGATPASASISQ